MNNYSPQQLKFFKIWFILGLAKIIIIYCLCFIPISLPSMGASSFDKVLHFGTYFYLGSWFIQLYQKPGRLILLFFFMGFSIELIQHQLPFRSFEFDDILANTIGILMGIAIFYIYPLNYLLKVEKFFKK